MARRKPTNFGGALPDRQLTETRQLIELSTRMVAQARFQEATSAELVRQSRSAIADTLKRFELGGVAATTMAHESRREMSARHVAEQEHRVAKQKALVARLSAHRLPTEQADDLLAQMLDMLEDMRSELARLSGG
jgi:hypothetical protein